MSNSKIGTIEAIMLILTNILTSAILSIPRSILVTTGSSSIINLIYVSIIAIFIALLIVKLLRNFPGFDIIDISEFIGGKIFRNIIGSIFIIYFIFSSSILLRNFCESLKIIYFAMTDIPFIILLFIIALCIANRLEFSATLKTNLIISPIVFICTIFLFFANMNKFVPQRIFPILGNGLYDTFILGLTNIASFGGLVYLYFLPPLLKEPKKLKNISIIAILFTSLYIILCVSTLLFTFSSFIDINEISPLYNATRYIEFGSFFQRLESIFLIFWILSFACYLSIVSKFAMNIFKKITNIKTEKPLTNIFGLLFLAVSLLPENCATSISYETKLYPILTIGIDIFLGLSILIIANISKKEIKYNNEQTL